MKITRKRILALNLAFLMLLTLLLPVSAADTTDSTEYCTLTIKGGDGTTINGAHEMTVQVEKNTTFFLDDLFHQDYAYVDYYTQTVDGVEENYGKNGVNTDLDELTLTAHWAESKYKVPVVCLGNGEQTVDGSQNGWKLPKPDDNTTWAGGERVFLGWSTNSEPHMDILAESEQEALARSRSFYATYTSRTSGIIFDFSGKKISLHNRDKVLGSFEYMFNAGTETISFSDADGKVITGWNTMPDGTGTSYAAYDETVEEAKTSIVRLYAQFAEEGSIELYVNSRTYDNPETLYVLPGTSVTLPDPGVITGQRFCGWDAYYEIGNSGYSFTLQSGEPFNLPAGATYAQVRANWLPEEQLVINGQEFTIEDSVYYYYEDENGARTASFYYDTYWGNAYLYLDDYEGGAIRLPCDTKLTTNEGYKNAITAESGPAVSCTGNLGLYSYCTDNDHAKLTINGAPGSPVLKATGGVNIDRAPHTVLKAGAGGSIAGAEHENIFLLSDCYTYTYQNSEGEQNLTCEDDVFKSLAADVTYLQIEPKTVTLTVDGGGGKTANGATKIAMGVEAEQSITLDSLGFTNPGYYRNGFNNAVNAYDVSIRTDSTITLNWVNTDYKQFLALDLNGEKLQDTTQNHVYIDNNTGKHVLFVDYTSDTLEIPEVELSNPNSEILYWYTSYGTKYERSDSKQFFTGETITKTDVPEGSTLYAKGTGSNWNIYLAISANGKTFAGGRRIITRSSNYLPRYTASDGSQVYYYSTDPKGEADRYMPEEYNNLPRGTKLYAIWLEEGEIPVTIEDRANNEKTETTAKAGEMTLPTPTAKAGLTFAYWSCAIRHTDGSYTSEEVAAGGSLTIPDDTARVYICARWSLNTAVKVGSDAYTFAPNQAYQSGDGWWIWYNSQDVKLTLTLDGYTGGSIELPVQTDVSVEGYTESTITGTLTCADTLSFKTDCAYGEHSELTIEPASGPAIDAPRVYFERAPHVTLKAKEGSTAFAGEPEVTGGDMITYHAVDAVELAKDEFGMLNVEGLREFYTRARMSTLTLDGNGGKTAAGKTSTTVDLEYGEGYSLRATGFKKQYSDVVGFVENTGTDTYYYYEWPNSICVQSPAVTLTINWRELGFPYIAFRGNGLLTGPGVTSEVRVSYANKNEEREVLASDYVYADAVSNGDLVYWFSSEDGTETDSSRQYLAGEVVSEPDDTTLYARAIRSGQVALVAPGTTFENGKHVMVSNTLNLTTLKSKEGKTIESWNTKPDGTGASYALDAELQYETPRILYAQWKTNLTVVPETDPETEEKVLQIQQKTDSGAEKVEIQNTSPKETAFEQAKRVILAAYENGRFVGMVNAEALNGTITCRIPKKYESCELKLFFMEGGKPKQDMEIIRLPARTE